MFLISFQIFDLGSTLSIRRRPLVHFSRKQHARPNVGSSSSFLTFIPDALHRHPPRPMTPQHCTNGYDPTFHGKAAPRILTDTTVEDATINVWYANAQAANTNADWECLRDAIVPQGITPVVVRQQPSRSKKGAIQMYSANTFNSSAGTPRAKTNLPVLGVLILSIKTTEDGEWILATCKNYLVVIRSQNNGIYSFKLTLCLFYKPLGIWISQKRQSGLWRAPTTFH
ncbi:hypothetical protein PROFUN_07097 [Planoprotostelium fungivorum]|uniref:Vacuolar import/degradation Vid27 C-terminal domain-containing protein n=1 Tax=Planoprotostelium fungivorum TaxID=1890364 RepID=A0A2P6NN67_9EUKA|nr:hypothetical protein PROFUN_07097 [Planoprotostelium fungivorum]